MFNVKKKKMKVNGTPLKPKLCFSCGAKGHFIKDCPLKQKGQEERDPLPVKLIRRDKASSQPQCFGCGTIGHKRNDCPHREDSKREKALIIARTENLVPTISLFGEGKSTDLQTNGIGVPSPTTETEKLEGKRTDLPETEKVEHKKADLQTVNHIDKVPPPTEEPEKPEDLEFTWGKKGGVGGKKREVQFYRSFTYDGVEYNLYDCVYMHKEGEPEPYIGKLIKIWEHADKTKKVKVQWFFRPSEISHWLGNEIALDNEVFLASGEGTGLANVNFLEAIGGKCNIICISKDNRNPQPSAEEIKMADYVFYRTFDVSSCTISDQMDDKVGGLESKFIFNSKGSENDNGVPKLNSHTNEDKKNAEVSNEPLQVLVQNPSEKSKTVNTDEKMNSLPGDLRDSSIKLKSLPGDLKDGMSSGEDFENRPSKKARVDKSTDKVEGKNKKVVQDLPVRGNDERKSLACASLKEKTISAQVKDKSMELVEGKNKKVVQDLPIRGNDERKSVAGASLIENSISAQVKDKSTELVEEKNKIVVQDLPVRGNDERKSVGSASLKGEIISAQIKDKSRELVEDKNKKLAKDLHVHESDERKLVASGSLKEKRIPTQVKDKSTKLPEGKSKNVVQDSPIRGNVERKLSTSVSFKEKTISTQVKDSLATLKRVNSAIDGGDSKDKLSSKKARLDNSCEDHINTEKSNNNPSKAFDRNNSKDFAKPRIVKDSTEANRLNLDAKITNGKLKKVLALESADEDSEVEGHAFEVTRRPESEKASWFEKTPWEERMQKAHEKETLVLLQNLDPKYTSEEVEDIIWRAFKENCDAKMVQKTTSSSPHFGQAYIILKTKEAASKIINKLDEECLMLTNGRPLVACLAPPPCLAKKQSTFFGHLVIDNLKNQNQREKKEAVSTSHCSQPNTIEYEMAMEWCLLQSRSDSWWTRLFKQQGEELRKLKAKLKSK